MLTVSSLCLPQNVKSKENEIEPAVSATIKGLTAFLNLRNERGRRSHITWIECCDPRLVIQSDSHLSRDDTVNQQINTFFTVIDHRQTTPSFENKGMGRTWEKFSSLPAKKRQKFETATGKENV